jgi:hypothetical protein
MDIPVAAASVRQSLNRNPALCRIVHLETGNRNVVWMEVTSSPISHHAAVVFSAVAKIVLQPAGTTHTLKPGSSSLARSIYKIILYPPLDDGFDVCMIRNKKSH